MAGPHRRNAESLNRSAEQKLLYCRGLVLVQTSLKDSWNMSGTNRMVRKLTALFKAGGNGTFGMNMTFEFTVLDIMMIFPKRKINRKEPEGESIMGKGTSLFCYFQQGQQARWEILHLPVLCR